MIQFWNIFYFIFNSHVGHTSPKSFWCGPSEAYKEEEVAMEGAVWSSAREILKEVCYMALLCFADPRVLPQAVHNRDLKIRRFSPFPASRERQKVTWPVRCRQVCGLKFRFVRQDHVLEVIYRKVFLRPKSPQSHVWEETLPFRTISFINYRILF